MAGAFARDFRTRLQKRKSLDSPAGMYVKQGEPTCALREERAAAILQLMRQSEQRGQYAIAVSVRWDLMGSGGGIQRVRKLTERLWVSKLFCKTKLIPPSHAHNKHREVVLVHKEASIHTR